MTTPAQIIPAPAQIDLEILDFQEQQLKDGRAKETVRSRIQVLKQVSKIADLHDPEIVKLWLADTENKHNFLHPCKWNNKTKIKFIDTYSAYLRYKGIQWNPPKYTPQQRLPFIPTEHEIDLLISATGKMLSVVLQTIKETGIRIGELILLKWSDLDTERKTLNITPEKNSNPRILPISDKLIGMIKNLPKDPRAKYPTMFQNHKDTLRDYLCTQRKYLAEKLGNPRLQKISFHTLRHWKGTMEYHKTKDIVHVKTVLGHKSITSTMIYINLESAFFLTPNDGFVCKVAHTIEEATQLLEAGFDYVTDMDGAKLFKKRK